MAVAMHLAASQLVVGLIGALVLHVGLFLHETEEGKIQNRLEKLWVDIDGLWSQSRNGNRWR